MGYKGTAIMDHHSVTYTNDETAGNQQEFFVSQLLSELLAGSGEL